MQPNCPICSGGEQNYLFTILGARIQRCAGCGLVRSPASPTATPAPGEWAGFETEADAADCYAKLISGLADERSNVLIVASGPHPLARSLKKLAFQVTYCSVESLHKQLGEFDAVVFLYTLEKFPDPARAIVSARARLREEGLLFVCTPSLDSRIARFFGKAWVHWASCNSTYFSRSTIQLLLEKSGFGSIWFDTDRRIFNLHHVADRLRERRWHLVAHALLGIERRVALLNRPWRFSTSGMIVTAVKKTASAPVTLSVIMPVYNERATVATTLNSVLAKEIDGVNREIIVVESNSSDGSREIVSAFQGVPGVKVVFEEKPRGKGFAVRTGFAHARGEIILIQDADIEYDINDYDELLRPLLEWRELFVLGSRHQGDWKMRSFTDNPALAIVFNFGQIFFTWLMNTLYRQKMTDPFTMYKVFRRECLFGLSFECNRFDFDHELVIKFLRKGYRPRELPVNYWSRSYSEGKKVTIFGDPITWIKANFKFRFVSPFQKKEEAYQEFLHRAQVLRIARANNRSAEEEAFMQRSAPKGVSQWTPAASPEHKDPRRSSTLVQLSDTQEIPGFARRRNANDIPNASPGEHPLIAAIKSEKATNYDHSHGGDTR